MVLKANINALNLMRAAIGSRCKLINRGVTCVIFGSLKIYLAATFWINCKGLIELSGRPAKTALKYNTINIYFNLKVVMIFQSFF